ncbi:hypothetical protein ABVT39_004903 [Epinephelus coioides]
MNGLSKTSLDLQNTKRIHNLWKSRMHNFIQSPMPWRKINRQETNETSLLGESLETLLSKKCNFHLLSSNKTNVMVGFCFPDNEVMFSCVKGGQKAFRDFLKSEFCEENLDFWLACQEFKTSDSQEDLTRRAASIYKEFVKAESPKQVIKLYEGPK